MAHSSSNMIGQVLDRLRQRHDALHRVNEAAAGTEEGDDIDLPLLSSAVAAANLAGSTTTTTSATTRMGSSAAATAIVLPPAAANDLVAQSNRRLSEATVSFNIATPSSTSTRVKNKVARASLIRERLRADMTAYDESIFFLCRKYHTIHRKQHTALKNDHRVQMEKALMQMSFRDRWNKILENPAEFIQGRVVAAVSTLLVLFSLIQFMLETVPSFDPDFYPNWRVTWLITESIVTLYFTAESTTRFVLSRDKARFFIAPLNVLDIVAVLPFYIQLIVADQQQLAIIKLVRACRFFKLFRSFKHINYIVETLMSISGSLIAPLLFLLTTVVIVSSALFFVEKGTYTPPSDTFLANLTAAFNASNYTSPSGYRGDAAVYEYIALHTHFFSHTMPDCFCESTAAYITGNRTCSLIPAQFTSILQTMWYTVVSMTTVGYGDFTPNCGSGKVIATLGLAQSTIFLAMPIAIVGVSFTDTVARAKRADEERKRIAARSIATLRVAAEIASTEAKSRGVNDDGVAVPVSGGGDATTISMGDAERREAASAVANLATTRTAGEACLVHVANALRCRMFDFSNLRALDYMGRHRKDFDPTVVAHHIDVFFSLVLQGWIFSWAGEQLQAIMTSGAAVDSALAASRLETLHTIQRTPFCTANWYYKFESLTHAAPEKFPVSASRCIFKEVTLSAPVRFRIVAIARDGDGVASRDGAADDGGNRGAMTSAARPHRGAAPSGRSKLTSTISAGRRRTMCVGGVETVESTHPAMLEAQILLNLYCQELLLPQDVAYIVVRHAFMTRIVTLFPASPLHDIEVNGVVVPADRGTVLHNGDLINFTPQLILSPAIAYKESVTLRLGSLRHIRQELARLEADDGASDDAVARMRVDAVAAQSAVSAGPSGQKVTVALPKASSPAGGTSSRESTIADLRQQMSTLLQAMGLQPITFRVNFRSGKEAKDLRSSLAMVAA